MNFEAIRYIVRKFYSKTNRRGFAKFAWWASIISIVLGVVALIVSISILDGFQSAIQENAVRFTSHIKVFTFDRKPFEQADSIVNNLIKVVPEISSAYPSVSSEVIIRYKNFVEGISLQSLNPMKIKNLREIVIGSQKNNGISSEGIILGKMLAKRIGAKIGDTVVILKIDFNEASNEFRPNFFRFPVAGFFESGMAKYDDVFAFADEELIKRINKYSTSSANSIEIYLKDLNKIDSVVKKIETVLGYPFYCFTYYDLHSSIFAWIELQKEPIPIVLSLITIVAVFNVATFLLINIVEKTRDIGILSTLGLKPREIVMVFLTIGYKIALLGSIIGGSISLLFSLLQKYFKIIHLDSKIYYFDSLPISIELRTYVIVLFFTFLVTFFAAFIPSLIASRLKPVDVLRFAK